MIRYPTACERKIVKCLTSTAMLQEALSGSPIEAAHRVLVGHVEHRSPEGEQRVATDPASGEAKPVTARQGFDVDLGECPIAFGARDIRKARERRSSRLLRPT